MSVRKIGIALAFGAAIAAGSSQARAQNPADAPKTPLPSHDSNWGTVSSITMGLAGATQLLMPRIFYADPEVTQGWKARWHVSVLAPTMTLTVLTFMNEYALKNAIKDSRPGCDDTNQRPGGPCATYGGPSSHAFGAFAALGHGVGVWLFDTTKWNGGRVNGGALAGQVIAPFIFAGITGIGRAAGNYTTTAQVLEGGAAGLAFGFLSGMTYALMQRPECGYTGSLICW